MQQRADLRCDDEGLVPAPHHRHFTGTQKAEPALEDRLEQSAAVGECIIANAEKREIVCYQPIQEIDRLGDLGDGQGRRLALELGNRLADARQHDAPVRYADAHVAQHALQRFDDLGALPSAVDAIGMKMNEALAQRAVQ